jgi:hypothetical protein
MLSITGRKKYILLSIIIILFLIRLFIDEVFYYQKNSTIEKEKVISYKVFLDHGGFNMHAEVFYSVAKLIITQILPTKRNIVAFTIDKEFGNLLGLTPFWDKYWNVSELGTLGHKYEFKSIKTLLSICNKGNVSIVDEYDYVVFVSTHNIPT